MNEKRILIAEDDIISANLLRDSLTSSGFQVTLAENGRKAMEYYSQNPFPIVITDYDMPEMNGSQLIDYLKEKEEEPIIIVLTNHSETSLIIEIMKKGIFDYLVKPIESEELSLKLNHAIEIYEMRRLDRITKREREIRLEGHLDWNKWKERAGGSGKFKNVNQNLFESLKTSFNQGTGFGALVSLLKIVADTAQKVGDNYQIDTGLMDLIHVNSEMAEKALTTFSEIEYILNGNIEMEKVSLRDIYEDIEKIITNISPFLPIRNNHIYLSEKKSSFENFELNINRAYLEAAITEIILNACKFSSSDSSIHIVNYIERNSFVISIYNSPVLDADRIEGIPLPYENLVFEPFFRLTKFVYDEYKTLDFGLGLTKVESILKKFNGKVEIKNIIDHLNHKTKPTTKVLCRISLPIV
ncbi:response regulator [Leptospira ognonensis]|uniref:Response regulator n=1 Tax=Leptospira ognonensis TaxID=2484945 RepID=A0A4R9JXW9_9LEPT|nr:response regulator [Leptospira ognonensis]TGL56991.1 response regulator [Leptospira ognonensis]